MSRCGSEATLRVLLSTTNLPPDWALVLSKTDTHGRIVTGNGTVEKKAMCNLQCKQSQFPGNDMGTKSLRKTHLDGFVKKNSMTELSMRRIVAMYLVKQWIKNLGDLWTTRTSEVLAMMNECLGGSEIAAFQTPKGENCCLELCKTGQNTT